MRPGISIKMHPPIRAFICARVHAQRPAGIGTGRYDTRPQLKWCWQVRSSFGGLEFVLQSDKVALMFESTRAFGKYTME